MMEKKERAKKYHISTKDSKDPLVTLAADEADAAARWAKRTGHAEKDAVVTAIGTRAETITRGEKPAAAASLEETKPAAAAANKESKNK